VVKRTFLCIKELHFAYGDSSPSAGRFASLVEPFGIDHVRSNWRRRRALRITAHKIYMKPREQ
jgi:hypothetical protein